MSFAMNFRLRGVSFLMYLIIKKYSHFVITKNQELKMLLYVSKVAPKKII